MKPVPLLLFYLGPALALPFGAWLAIWRRDDAGASQFRCPISRKSRFLLLVVAAIFVGLALPIYLPFPHYAAALTAAVYALVLEAMRSLRLWRPEGRPAGKFLVRAVPLICFILLPERAAAQWLHISLPPTMVHTWCSGNFHNLDRARILKQLENERGKHLVLVRYDPEHEVFEEWVYNGADIDGSKVVWARDTGTEKNQSLIEYFNDRQVWLVKPDEKPVRVEEYR